MNVTYGDVKSMDNDELAREWAKYNWIMEQEGKIKVQVEKEIEEKQNRK